MRSDTMPSRRAMLAGLAAGPTFGRGAPAQHLPVVAVTKAPGCGCCEKWVARPREAGFTVAVSEGAVNLVKACLGLPLDLVSCHTAQVGSYLVEGHVAAGAIKPLLTKKPLGTCLAVPGMPTGSPGMEVEGMEPGAYEVVLFGPVGRETFIFCRGANPV